MNDADLLIFGCAVSFIGLAGAYVYIRECFSKDARESERADDVESPAASAPTKLRDVA